MSDESETVKTFHGVVDRAALTRLEQTYDMTWMLCAVDELAELLRGMLGEEGWRERFLAVHAMAHTVINGAGYTGPKDGTLTEMAMTSRWKCPRRSSSSRNGYSGWSRWKAWSPMTENE